MVGRSEQKEEREGVLVKEERERVDGDKGGDGVERHRLCREREGEGEGDVGRGVWGRRSVVGGKWSVVDMMIVLQ